VSICAKPDIVAHASAFVPLSPTILPFLHDALHSPPTHAHAEEAGHVASEVNEEHSLQIPLSAP
jgi:hypothetical protein